jgi:hypothetical protein
MYQGNLLWLSGRVGEANYTYFNDNAQTCTLILPMVIGNSAGSGIGITETIGLTIKVVSQQLNDAIINGDRVFDTDWHFSVGKNGDYDGIIISGIQEGENFILNSRRKWISWLSGKDEPKPECS